MSRRCSATSRSSGFRESASSTKSSQDFGSRTATRGTAGSTSQPTLPAAATTRPQPALVNTPLQGRRAPDGRRLLRFDRVERVAHWANALLFGILMATALPLYFVQVESLVGRRELIAQIHTWSGVALPIPLIVSLAGPWGARLRRDVR